VPKPPRIADLKARIAAQIRRDGFSFISHEELSSAWPNEFGSAMLFGLLTGIAADEDWVLEYQSSGVRFTRRSQGD
jgi:hypothetical protein